MASFPTACQSGDPRAGRSAGACGLTCALCGSPGAKYCCNRSATKICFPSTPVSTPRTTARNGRSVPDEHRTGHRSSGPRSPIQWWSWRPPVRLVSPLWFSYTRGRKNQQGNLNRDQATLEQELKGWAELYPRRQSPDIPAGQGELEGFRPHRARHSKATRKICHFFITKDQWPPSSTDLKPIGYTMWSVLEKEAWSNPHKKI